MRRPAFAKDTLGNFLDYGDYHQPTTITETGDLSRATSRTYNQTNTFVSRNVLPLMKRVAQGS